MGKTDIIYFYNIQFTSYKRHFEDTQLSQPTVLQKLSLISSEIFMVIIKIPP